MKRKYNRSNYLKQKYVFTINQGIFLLLFIGLILFNGCRKLEYVEIDIKPQIEITVLDETNTSIKNAEVKLYDSETNFNKNENHIEVLLTDEKGKVLFKELEERIYYFYAEKNDLNNFFGVASFSNPLQKNEIRTISCIIK